MSRADVRAVGFRARTEIRRSLRFLVVGGVLAGLVAGVVVATAIGARRNASAFSRFLDSSQAATVLVNPDLGSQSKLTTATVARLPQVVDVGRIDGLLALIEDRPGHVDMASANNIEVLALRDGHALRTLARPKMLAGSLPDPDDLHGVLVSPALARQRHLRIGSVLVVHPGRLTEAGNPELEQPIRMRVRGIGRIDSDIVAADGSNPARIIPSEAFDRRYRNALLYFGLFVRLRHGVEDLPALRAAVARQLPHEGIEYQTVGQISATVHRATSPGTIALALFAVVLGLTALIAASQAVVRRSRARTPDFPALRAMGMEQGQLFGSEMLVVVTFAAIVAAVSVPVAIACSGRFPIGPARIAEPHPGTVVDVLGLLIGATAVLVSIVLLAATGVYRAVRSALAREQPASPPAWTMRVLRSLGVGFIPTLGIGAATDSGRGRAVPARTMLAGMSLGLAALIGALVFGANLDGLLTTPARYGWNWDAVISVSKGDQATQADIDQLEHGLTTHAALGGVARLRYASLLVDGHAVPAIGVASLRGGLAPVVVTGRDPATTGEIALGRRTLRLLHRRVGDVVRVARPRGGATRMRVVGVPAFPALSNYSGTDSTELGSGALVTQAALRIHAANYDPNDFDLLVKTSGSPRSGTQLDAVLQPYHDLFAQGDWLQHRQPQRPTDVVGLTYVRNVPVALAGILAALALVVLTNVLLISLRARRNDFAVLKAMGLVRREIFVVVTWQATTIALMALVFATLIGTVAGRLAWIAVANQVGVVPHVTTPILPLILVAAATLVVANLVALGPGVLAARTPVARLLRSE
ncbi:MAG: hypothetical protein JWL73_2993 [Actinomycetia bacterium]|nr:hypothetical protein [Actinomycetes bacterium]